MEEKLFPGLLTHIPISDTCRSAKVMDSFGSKEGKISFLLNLFHIIVLQGGFHDSAHVHE